MKKLYTTPVITCEELEKNDLLCVSVIVTPDPQTDKLDNKDLVQSALEDMNSFFHQLVGH